MSLDQIAPYDILLLVGLFICGFLLLGMLMLLTRGRSRAERDEAQALAQRTQGLERSLSSLFGTQNELGGRLHQLSEIVGQSHAHLSQLLEVRLEAVNQRLGESLYETSMRTHEQLGTLQSRLAVIDEAQRNIMELSGQVVSLQEILSNRHARGLFGETQLADLVANALPPSGYSLQAVLKNGKRVDCLIAVPMPPGPIGIDAKFPLEAYHALRAAETPEARASAEKAFRQAVLKHVQDIAERYIVPGETADSALMFLPSEAVYAELHARFQDVVEKSYRARVWIVSPTTLMATLNTVRAILRDARMREQAGAIQKEVTALTGDVRRLQTRAYNLRTHFEQARKDIDEVLVSADRVTRTIDRIEALEVEGPEDPRAAAKAAPPARMAGANGAHAELGAPLKAGAGPAPADPAPGREEAPAAPPLAAPQEPMPAAGGPPSVSAPARLPGLPGLPR